MRSILLILGLMLLIETTTAANYYVDTNTGNDSDDGLSLVNAWLTLEHADGQLSAGDTLYLVDGIWSNQHMIITNSGSVTHPIVITAYNGTPTLNGTDDTGDGIIIQDTEYIEVYNIAVKKYNNGFRIKNSSNVLLDNDSVFSCAWGGFLISNNASYNIIINCTAYNNDMTNFVAGSDSIHNTFDSCYSYYDSNLARKPDYGISATNGANYTVIDSCIIGNKTDIAQGGHGICFTGPTMADPGSHHNTVKNTSVYNWNEGAGARDGCSDITFQDCHIEYNLPDVSYIGLYFRSGATEITLDNCTTIGFTEAGIAMKSDSSNGTITNCISYGFDDYGIQMAGSGCSATNCVSTDWNGTGEGAGIVVIADSIVKNCIITDCKRGIHSYLGVSGVTTYNNVWNNTNDYTGGTSAGTGCISVDPLFVDFANHDFHLKSQYGRWNGTTWITDASNSPCIDTGDSNSTYSNEPSPNGYRINMGAYGNTIYASKSSWAFSSTGNYYNTTNPIEITVKGYGNRSHIFSRVPTQEDINAQSFKIVVST